MKNSGLLRFLPVVGFGGLMLVFWIGLYSNPRNIPSALINTPVPAFNLPGIEGLPIAGLRSEDLKQGKVTVINIWASWCGPCRNEHPVLMELAKRKDIRIVGINNKDEPNNAKRFLNTLGQPFAAIGVDASGRTTIDWGSYGVPETFIVDGEGVIRYKFIGGLTASDLTGTLTAEITKAKTPIKNSTSP